SRPGRLCRGQERWIQSLPIPDEPTLHRLVISGAAFTDDSARDALRGLNRSGIDMGALLSQILPGGHLVAFKEQGELAVVPEGLEDEDETFRVARRGGAWFEGCQRWRMMVEEPEDITTLLEQDNVDGFLWLEDDLISHELEEALYLLSGMAEEEQFPVKRFQPAGVVEVLKHAKALVAVHLDKHGPALAIYTHDPLYVVALLEDTAESAGSLAVPFAIPPMLARWDRALQELRVRWTSERDTEFPVPPANEPTRWSRLGQARARALSEE
ncbi:MAG: hypothetical protein ACI9VR_005386, partial [Cognaticolwellia sp.]